MANEFTLATAYVDLAVRQGSQFESAMSSLLKRAGSGGSFASAGAGAAGGGGSFASAGAAATSIAGLAKSAFDANKALVDWAAGFVRYGNPAAFERYQWALDDFSGVLGRQLTPIIRAATEIARKWADVLATSGKGIEQLASQWGSIMTGIADAATPLIEILGGLASVIAGIIEKAGGAQKTGGILMGMATQNPQVAAAMQLFQKIGAARAAASQGASVGAGNTSMPTMGGLVEARNQMMMKALFQSMGEKPVEERQLAVLENIEDLLSENGPNPADMGLAP